jgi:hypothetical protein
MKFDKLREGFVLRGDVAVRQWTGGIRADAKQLATDH